ncbi:hypothetical protein P376_0350 [Streptomyces sp. HCCB10043]|nr:hypothetical protein P376_0350 [Streptomyces sp. HCCB10043]
MWSVPGVTEAVRTAGADEPCRCTEVWRWTGAAAGPRMSCTRMDTGIGLVHNVHQDLRSPRTGEWTEAPGALCPDRAGASSGRGHRTPPAR